MNKESIKPVLTIGMPVYNGEETIGRALAALLAQTFEDFNIIISDNSSTDRTVAICEEFSARDPRISLIRQDRNQGATENFLYLLRCADSEFFMWAAADDVWLPDFLTRCIKKFSDDPDVMFSMSAFKSISRTSRFFNKSFPNLLAFVEDNSPERRVRHYQSIPYESQKDNLVYSIWRTDFLKVVIEEFHSSPSHFTIGGEMNEFALRRGKGAFVDYVLFHKVYRVTPPGHWLDKFKLAFDKFTSKLSL